MKLLFIGDSITDCGRQADPEQMGQGYVRNLDDYFKARHTAVAPRVVNRGISGNKVTDLAARWERNVIAERPDVLSVKIGINDVWHGLSGGPGVPINEYLDVYRKLLNRVWDALPECEIVLCEPSVIWPPSAEGGNEALQPYVHAVRELGREFGAAAVVPLHGAFVRAREQRPDVEWTYDGVHPTSAGHLLIALSWLEATRLL